MSRREPSKKSAAKHETEKLASKTSTSSKKHSGELNDEQLDRIAGGSMSYAYHGLE